MRSTGSAVVVLSSAIAAAMVVVRPIPCSASDLRIEHGAKACVRPGEYPLIPSACDGAFVDTARHGPSVVGLVADSGREVVGFDLRGVEGFAVNVPVEAPPVSVAASDTSRCRSCCRSGRGFDRPPSRPRPGTGRPGGTTPLP